MNASAAAMESAVARAGVSLAAVLEWGLILAVPAAVISFGGTQPIVFASVSLLLFGMLGALVWSRDASLRAMFPWPAIALLLIGMLQAVPARELFPGFPALTVDAHATREQLLIFAACIAAFAVARFVCSDPMRRRRFVLVLLLLAAAESFYALGQALTDSREVFGRLKPYGAEDASGTYVNRNHFAGFLGLTLPFALGFALTQPRRNAPRGIAGDSLLPRRAFWLFVTSVFFLSVVLSKSRMGIVACSGGTLAVAALRAGLGENRKPVVKTIAALMVIAFALSAWVGAGPALDRFGALDREFAQQGRGRWEIWKDTSRLIAERPWLGSGLGTFGVAYTAVQTTFLDRFVHHAHNDYLQVAAELGIPGAVLLFGTLGGVAWRTARILQQPVKESDPAVALGVVGALTAFLLHSLTDFNLYIPANALTLSCVLALGCACSHRQCERSV